MLTIDIPGRDLLELEYLVLDLNGTIAADGVVFADLAATVSELSKVLQVIVLTADTHGNADALASGLVASARVIERGREAESKLDVVDELGAQRVVAIGNGANDALMLRDAALGIAVVGPEGAATGAIMASDVVTTCIADALGLLLEPPRLIATLRE